MTLAELAGIPEQDEAFRGAAMLIPDASRWKPALVAVADHRAADAAEIYHDIGSRPLEAAAHVLAAVTATAQHRHAESAHHAKQALDFYQTVGAVTYAERMRMLVRPSRGRPAWQGRVGAPPSPRVCGHGRDGRSHRWHRCGRIQVQIRTVCPRKMAPPARRRAPRDGWTYSATCPLTVVTPAIVTCGLRRGLALPSQ